MATVPVRSQPLHNFSLPFLKWGKNQMNNQRCRKSSVDSSQEFPPLDHRSSSSASETESDREIELENRKNPIVSSSSRSVKHHRLPDILMLEKKNPTMLESEAAAGGVEEGKSDFLVCVCSSKDESPSVEKKKNKNKNKPSCVVVVDVLDAGAGGGEESATKPWNLRPRRVVFKAAPIEIEGGSRGGEMMQQQQPPENLPKSLRLRGVSAEGGQNVEKKKEKRKFWISLSREEIEEDFFIMTGSKPSRRPKKRARNIQKQVDNVFPGLWLAGITADSYIVPDVPAKVFRVCTADPNQLKKCYGEEGTATCVINVHLSVVQFNSTDIQRTPDEVLPNSSKDKISSRTGSRSISEVYEAREV